MNNFECTVTGKQYNISGFKSKVGPDGTVRYYKSGPGWEELRSDDGHPLRRLHSEQVPLLGIKTDTVSKFSVV